MSRRFQSFRLSLKDHSLTDIQEAERQSEQARSPRFHRTSSIHAKSTKNSTIHFRKSLPPLQKQVADCEAFLYQLKQHRAYQKFIQQAIKACIIQRKLILPREYHQKFITSGRIRTATAHGPRLALSTRNQDRPLPASIDFEDPQKKSEPKERLATSHSRNSYSRKSSVSRESNINTQKRRLVLQKAKFIQKTNPEVKKTYNLIARHGRQKVRDPNVTIEALRDYLNARYCNQMAEVFLNVFTINQFINIDQYSNDLDRLVMSKDEKMLKVCFELFDFNKDKYICNSDLFSAVSNRKINIFDQDIVKIREQCKKKRKGELQAYRIKPLKQKAQSSLLNSEDFRPKIPHYHPSKPEAITFEDFYRIHFLNNKPQIIRDFITYMTGIPLEDKPAIPVLATKASEEIIQEISKSSQARENLLSDPRYFYYIGLQEAIQSYIPAESVLLLQKFNMMVCPTFKKIRVLSQQSIHQKWETIFGSKNAFLQTSFYRILAGPEFLDVTKDRFLNGVSLLFKETRWYIKNQFAFSLYDKSKDGLIGAREVHDFFISLPQNTVIYKEASVQDLNRLVDEYLLSIFGKRHNPLTGIDINLFNSLIPTSVLVQDFQQALLAPAEKLPYKNKSFNQTVEISPEKIKAREESAAMLIQNFLRKP